MLFMWQSCTVLVEVMCCLCGSHVLFMWKSCAVHVEVMCCSCDTHRYWMMLFTLDRETTSGKFIFLLYMCGGQ